MPASASSSRTGTPRSSRIDVTCYAGGVVGQRHCRTAYHKHVGDYSPLNQALARRKSELRASRRQSREAFEVVVSSESRRAVLSAIDPPERAIVWFADREVVGWSDIDGLGAIVHALGLWLEDDVSSGVLASNLPGFVRRGDQPRKP